MAFLRLLIFVVGLVAAFVIGRKTGEKGPLYVTEVKELPTTTINLASPTPIRLTYYSTDTVVLPIYVTVDGRVDTGALIQDYVATREYEFVNADSVSIDTITFKTRFNKVQDFRWQHRPFMYKTTVMPQPKVEWWVGGEFNTKYELGVMGGMKYNHLMFGLGANTSGVVSFKTLYVF